LLYAYTLSHAKVRPLPRDVFTKFVTALEADVTDRVKKQAPDIEPPRDLSVYYHPYTLCQIVAVRTALSELEEDRRQRDAVLFVRAMICGILHGDTPIYLSVQTKDTWSASARYVREYV